MEDMGHDGLGPNDWVNSSDTTMSIIDENGQYNISVSMHKKYFQEFVDTDCRCNVEINYYSAHYIIINVRCCTILLTN